MIGKLHGKIDSIYSDHIILNVTGIGYIIFLHGRDLSACSLGENTAFFIETHVREDHIHLYGFGSMEEKATFNTLTSVSGVGARLGMSILTNLTSLQIRSAVENKDHKAFQSISGIGEKMAMRITVELKGKVDKISFSETFVDRGGRDAEPNVRRDAIEALCALGIGSAEAENLVARSIGTYSGDKGISLDALIKTALSLR